MSKIARRIAIVRDPVCQEHTNGPWHPESPQRLQSIDAMLTGMWQEGMEDIPARDASPTEIAWVHTPEYIKRLELTQGATLTRLDPDTTACTQSYPAALRAAGGTIAAVDSVLSGRCAAAFAFVRPPGHHAEAERAMGFCLLNNVAVGAEYALREHRVRRILIVDWDVHHGNGTMHAFYDSDRVLYFSTHQYPYYPGTGWIDEVGVARGEGYTVNVPMSAGQGDREYLYVFQRILRPIVQEYNPELVLVSAGFDAHKDDPLAMMSVTNRGFRAMTAILGELAQASCQGQMVFVLEGGYNLAALGSSVSEVLKLMLTDSSDPSVDTAPPAPAVSTLAQQIADQHKLYWHSL